VLVTGSTGAGRSGGGRTGFAAGSASGRLAPDALVITDRVKAGSVVVDLEVQLAGVGVHADRHVGSGPACLEAFSARTRRGSRFACRDTGYPARHLCRTLGIDHGLGRWVGCSR
jgi:hypothetical protein